MTILPLHHTPLWHAKEKITFTIDTDKYICYCNWVDTRWQQ